jgi:type III pantothenate kinase
VTLDAVDGDGQHLGGLIMVSPHFAATALNRETSGIGRTVAPGEAPLGLTLLGRTTDEAVAHGAMLGLAAAVDRAVAVVTAELGAEPLVLVTGGDGQSLLPWLETRVQYRAHLVLEGLALIAAES